MKHLLKLTVSLLGFLPSPTQAQSDQVIYADALQNSWLDDSIHIGAVGITGQDSYPSTTHSVPNPNEGNALYRGWTPVVLANLKALGITPQFLVYHSYAQAPGAENDAQLLQASSNVAGSAANLRKLITDYFGSGGENIELQMTEVNSVFTSPGKQSVCLVNGLFMADMIGQISRSEFKACMWWDLRSASDELADSAISGPAADPDQDGSTDHATFRLTRSVSEMPGQFVRLLVMLSAPPGGSGGSHEQGISHPSGS